MDPHLKPHLNYRIPKCAPILFTQFSGELIRVRMVKRRGRAEKKGQFGAQSLESTSSTILLGADIGVGKEEGGG